MNPEDIPRIEGMLAEVFSKSCPGDGAAVLRRVESRSKVTVSSLTADTLEPFLSGMEKELEGRIEPWKIKFLLGVIRRILTKYL